MKSLSCVWLFVTPCSLPGSSVHGIFQARVLEWVAISFCRGSARLRDQTWVSHIVGRCFYHLSHEGSPLSAEFQRTARVYPQWNFFNKYYMIYSYLNLQIQNCRYKKSTMEPEWFCYLLQVLAEKAMATHSSTLAWKIPWTEEPGRLQSMGLQRVRHDWATSPSL